MKNVTNMNNATMNTAYVGASEIVNLTPHTINLVDGNGHEILAVQSTGLARLKVETRVVGYFMGIIPITENVYGDVEGLPDPEEGKLFVVSALVAQRVPERRDVLIPNELVRDEEGKIIGCKSLGHI